MEINADSIAEADSAGRFTQQVIERPIDGGDFGNDANRARH
jgi:hypothetical protein